MILHRRSFLTGLGASLFAAPAIVRAASLMPVKAIEVEAVWREIHRGAVLALDEYPEEMSQRLTQTILYGNPDYMPMKFAGLLPAWSVDA